MKSIQNIVDLASKYNEAFDSSNERTNLWNGSKRKIVYDTLSKICTELDSQVPFFSNNIYVISNDPDDIYIKSGSVSVPLQKEHEEGFQIHFLRQSNGVIYALAYGHSSGSKAGGYELAVIKDLNKISEEYVMELVYNGIENVMSSSYLFLGDD